MVNSSSSAPANQFVLLNWACVLYETLLKTDVKPPAAKPFTTLVGVIASMLDCLLDKSMRVKDTIRKGAVVRTRRAIRMVRNVYDRFYLPPDILLACGCDPEPNFCSAYFDKITLYDGATARYFD